MHSSEEIRAPYLTEPLSKRLAKVPWWGIILIMSGILIIYLIFSNANYQDTFLFLQKGVITTLRITLLAFPISLAIGLITGLARLSKNVFLYTISTLYVEIIRGIPLIVLMLMIAFAVVPMSIILINNFGNYGISIFQTGILNKFFDAFANFSIRSVSMELRAIIALSIGYGAFEAEVFRAGIQSINKGQMEAARSLGMSYFQSMRFIILPQAVRRILPPLGNDFIALLKDSSLATVLAVNELTQLTRIRRSSTFRVMEAFNIAAFLYLSMTLVLSAVVRSIEKKFQVSEQ